MNFQMEEITTVFPSLNRTWSVRTYNVETQKINWPVTTSVSARECANSLLRNPEFPKDIALPCFEKVLQT